MTLDEFNQATPDAASATLLACCDVPSWAARVRDARPFADADTAIEVADQAARALTPAEIERALAAHPRIGERAAGAGTEAAWSRQEQGDVARDAETQAALLEGNRAYEDRFGRVFLICATGLGGDKVLEALRKRLGNDEETEAAVVAEELRKIALLRLRKALT